MRTPSKFAVLRTAKASWKEISRTMRVLACAANIPDDELVPLFKEWVRFEGATSPDDGFMSELKKKYNDKTWIFGLYQKDNGDYMIRLSGLAEFDNELDLSQDVMLI